jgi:hypothetical protein
MTGMELSLLNVNEIDLLFDIYQIVINIFTDILSCKISWSQKDLNLNDPDLSFTLKFIVHLYLNSTFWASV